MIKTLKTIFFRGLSSVATLFFTFISTRIYGLDMVGEFAIFISISAFIFAFIKFGLEVPLFVDLTKAEDKNKYYILNHYKTLQNKIFIPYIFVGILLYFFGIKDIVYLYLTGFLMCKIALNTYAIRSLGYQDFFVLFQNGNANFFAIIFLFIFQTTNVTNPIISSFVIGNVILFILSTIVTKYIFKSKDQKNIDIKNLNSLRIIKDSFIYFCLDIVNNIFTWTPLLVIYFLFTNTEQGIYLNISKIGSVFIILLFILETIVMKDLAYFSTKSQFQKIKKYIQKPKIQVLTLASLIFITFYFFGNQILLMIDPEILKSDNNALILYSLSQIVVLYFGPLALFMKVSENHKQMLKIVMISSSLNLVLSFLISYYFGFIGIFISAIIGNLVWCIITFHFIKRKYGLSF
jgi:O-antigen/teichoic acid export membrane protein